MQPAYEGRVYTEAWPPTPVKTASLTPCHVQTVVQRSARCATFWKNLWTVLTGQSATRSGGSYGRSGNGSIKRLAGYDCCCAALPTDFGFAGLMQMHAARERLTSITEFPRRFLIGEHGEELEGADGGAGHLVALLTGEHPSLSRDFIFGGGNSIGREAIRENPAFPDRLFAGFNEAHAAKRLPDFPNFDGYCFLRRLRFHFEFHTSLFSSTPGPTHRIESAGGNPEVARGVQRCSALANAASPSASEIGNTSL